MGATKAASGKSVGRDASEHSVGIGKRDAKSAELWLHF
jgi:hypothetical protein